MGIGKRRRRKVEGHLIEGNIKDLEGLDRNNLQREGGEVILAEIKRNQVQLGKLGGEDCEAIVVQIQMAKGGQLGDIRWN